MRRFSVLAGATGVAVGMAGGLVALTYGPAAYAAHPRSARPATSLISVAADGSPAPGNSGSPAVSADGRYVAFTSRVANLVPGDTDNWADVFVRDRRTNVTTRVSVDSAGRQGNEDSGAPSISADGRYVAFMSAATNLVSDKTGTVWDVYVHDRTTGTTNRVSVGPGGVQANGYAVRPSISADGRYVAFVSNASNLVPNGHPIDREQVFVYDRRTASTKEVSVDSTGVEGNAYSGWQPAISANNRYVVFVSDASNLVPDDTNNVTDVFVHDLQTNATSRASVGADGAQAAGFMAMGESISADGRYVVFVSDAPNLVPGDTNDDRDVFVRDRKTGTTTRVNVGPKGEETKGVGLDVTISANGRYVAFSSTAANLVPGDTSDLEDVFVRDTKRNTTTLVSVGDHGTQSNLPSWRPAISADGHHVVFVSPASNLVPGDTNAASDVFIRDLAN